MASPPKRYFARGFAADAKTERALRAGLAGREVRIQRGRFPAALRSLAAEPASSLVFVDLDGISEPESAAAQLMGVCAFDTVLVAIGSTDTAQYSRSLLHRGVSDYLVKPVTAAAVRQAMAALTGDATEQPYAGEIVAFAGNPGSGTSTLVAALARGIAEEGRTATVVDLDPLCGKLAALLGVAPMNGLAEILSIPEAHGEGEPETPLSGDRIDEIATPAAPGVSLLAYPASGPMPAQPYPAALSELFKRLANRTHTVLVTGIADPELRIDVMRQADVRVVVFEPTLPSIDAAVRSMTRVGVEYPVTLVQCSTRMRRYPLSSAHVRYAFADRRPDAVIPFDPALHAAATGRTSEARLGKAYRKALLRAIELLGGARRT